MNFNQEYYMDDCFDKGHNDFNYDRQNKKYVCVKAIYFFPVCSYYNEEKRDDCKCNRNDWNRRDNCGCQKKSFFNCCKNF